MGILVKNANAESQFENPMYRLEIQQLVLLSIADASGILVHGKTPILRGSLLPHKLKRAQGTSSDLVIFSLVQIEALN